MSIHIDVYDTKAVKPYKTDHNTVDLIKEKFELVEEALNWWNVFQEMTGLRDDLVKEILEACATEYVGTEHELKTKDGLYSSIGLSIEGQVDVKTFDRRLPDFYVDEIIYMGDQQYQLNGHTHHYDPKPKATWMTVHLNGNVDFRPSKVIDLPE